MRLVRHPREVAHDPLGLRQRVIVALWPFGDRHVSTALDGELEALGARGIKKKLEDLRIVQRSFRVLLG